VPRPTKQALIDAIVIKVTSFTGDKRDGDVPPIKVENYHELIFQRSARAFRAHLSRMSYADLLREDEAAAAYVAWLKAYKENALAQQERDDREGERQKQAERGRRRDLQPELLEAAHDYRGRTIDGRKMNAGEAWDAIKKNPFTTGSGWIVLVSGPESHRLSQEMRAMLPNGTRIKRPIKFDHWRQRYWPAAKPETTSETAV
jgi:hypothetical protein